LSDVRDLRRGDEAAPRVALQSVFASPSRRGMIGTLRWVFSVILVVIVVATGWASSQMPFWTTPAAVVGHPWFIATLVDTYLAFFTYWLWVAYKVRRPLLQVLWLALIFGLGNIAMALFALIELWRLPPGAGVADFLLRRDPR
jgi:hypothetical protein